MAITLTVEADNMHELEYALIEVKRLTRQGYKRGLEPYFYIEGDEEYEDEDNEEDDENE